jgi:hypothetical protein
MPPGITGESATKVWREVLSAAAQKAARLPLVEVVGGETLAGVTEADDDRYAVFVRAPPSGPTLEDLQELAAACIELNPPEKDLAGGWSEVAEGWEQLGVDISWIDLEGIGKTATASRRTRFRNSK